MLLQGFLETVEKELLDNEERMALCMIDEIFASSRSVLGKVGLQNGRSISIIDVDGRFTFKYGNEKKGAILYVQQFCDILSGVEHFISVLDPCDAERLWEWFLEHGQR